MEKQTVKLLGCAVAGAAGAGLAMWGVKMIYDGSEELEMAYYDPRCDKLDMYEATTKATKKCASGIGLAAIGGALIGGSIGTAFKEGENSVIDSINAPVMISADSLEAAQRMLDDMKAIGKGV